MASDLQRAIDALAHRLDRSVAADDTKMRLIAHSPHRGPVDAARLGSLLNREVPAEMIQWAHALGVSQAQEPIRLPSNPPLGFDYPRVGVPIRSGGILLGYLWIIDPVGDMGDVEMGAAERCAAEAGAIIHRDQLLDQMRADQESQVVRGLLAADPADAADAARRAHELALLPPGDVAVVVIRAPAIGGAETAVELALVNGVERAARHTHPRDWLHSIAGDRVTVVVPVSSPAAEIARAVIDAVNHVHPCSDGARAGIGGAHPAAGAAASHREASDALTVAERTGFAGDVVTWDDLGAYRLLCRISDDDLVAHATHPGLDRLLSGDAGEELVQTLECYLDNAGAVKETAAALFVHRGSLYHRLERIERITGTDLAHGEDRLSLHLAIKAARLLGRVAVRVATATEHRVHA
jgi:hypothetical protein